MKFEYKIDPGSELAKSLSNSISDDSNVSKLAVKIALLKSIPKENWINKIFNRISGE